MAVLGAAGCVALACVGESRTGRGDRSEGGTSNGATSGGGTSSGGMGAGGTGTGAAGAGGMPTGGVPISGGYGGTAVGPCPREAASCDADVVTPRVEVNAGRCLPEDQGKNCWFYIQPLPSAACRAAGAVEVCCNGMWTGGEVCRSTGGAGGTGGEPAGGEGGAGFGGEGFGGEGFGGTP